VPSPGSAKISAGQAMGPRHDDPAIPPAEGQDPANHPFQPPSPRDEDQNRPSESSEGMDPDCMPVADRSSFFTSTPSFMYREEDARIESSASGEEPVWNGSCWTTISQNEKFQNLTLAIICINALWIGADTEWNHGNIITDDSKLPLVPGSTIVENLFCSYFTFEVVARFLSYKRKRACLTDGWFMFDSLLVFCMILETWVMKIVEAVGGGGGAAVLSNFSALRLMRLLRLTRMARLMQSVPELMMLVKGMISATKAVGFIILFLILVMYVFSIIMMSMMAKVPNEANGAELNDDGVFEWEGETGKFYFGSMGDAMMCLFTNGVLGDNLDQTVSAILEEGLVVTLVFWVFFAISSLTLLNMLIGVLCEVISKKADEEKSAMGEMDLRLSLTDAFNVLDHNRDGIVTVTEWEQMKGNASVRQSFANQGIDEGEMDEQLDKMQECIFNKKTVHGGTAEHGPGLSMEEFVTKLLEVQPSQSASVLELKLLRAKVEMRDGKIDQYLGTLEGDINDLLAARGIQQVSLKHLEKKDPGDKSKPAEPPSALQGVSTAALLEQLKKRTSAEPPRAAPSSQSAFPTPKAPEAREAGTSSDPTITHEERVLAKQHSLFQELEGRRPAGGWTIARGIATQLEKGQLTLTDLRERAAPASGSEIRASLDAVPEFFEQDRLNDTVTSRIPVGEEHVCGCPRHPSSNSASADNCQCVRRLCDALQLFTEG
jgi:voltage-gated sodium channel